METATSPSPTSSHHDISEQKELPAGNLMDSIDSKTSKRPAEDQSPNDDEKRQKLNVDHSIQGDQASKPDNGVNHDSSESKLQSDHSNSVSEPELEPKSTQNIKCVGGWNTGISSGHLRIGFSKSLVPNTADSTPEAPKSSPAKTVIRQKHSWIHPSWPEGPDNLSWDSRLEVWVDLFVGANKAAIRKLKRSDFLALVLDHVDINFSKAQKKHCRAAVMKYIRAGKWEAHVARFLSRSPSIGGSSTRSMSPPNLSSWSKSRGNLDQESNVDTHVPEKDDVHLVMIPELIASGTAGTTALQPSNTLDGMLAPGELDDRTTNLASPKGSDEPKESGSSEEGEVTPSESEDGGIVTESQNGEGHVKAGEKLLEESHTNSPQDEQELARLRFYFPGFAESDLCLACKGAGHSRSNCPYRPCKWCGRTDAHRFLACPLRIRCAKCQQLGHGAEVCVEKLKATAELELRCRHCDGAHMDSQCDLLWRTTYPDPAKVKKVKYIPVSCYTCGASGHYGTVCTFRDTPVTPADFTWTEENRAIYLDPECDKEAIAYSGPKPSPGLAMKIRGKARHVEYTDDDDSDDEGLIRAPVSRPQARGMKISANIHPSLPPLPPLPQAPLAPSYGRGGFSNLRRGGGAAGVEGGGRGGARGGGGSFRGGKFRGGRGKYRGAHG